MSAFANLPISRKLTVAFAPVVAVIFLSSAVIYSRVGVLDATLNDHLQTDHARDALDTMREAILTQKAGERGYMITGNESFLRSYRGARDRLAAEIRAAERLVSGDPAQQRQLDEVNALVRTWRENTEREIALTAKPETRAQAHAMFASGAGGMTMDGIITKVNGMEAAEAALGVQRLATLRRAYASTYMVTILAGIVSLVVAILMGVLLTRAITVPVRRMTSAMAALAKGDTGVEVPGGSRHDEIGAMAAAVRIFRDSMIDRNRAEDALRDSEELKRRIIESSRDCIKVLDLDGNLLFMSSGGQRLLEIENVQPYLNTCWIDFWPPEDRANISEAVAAAREGGIGQFQAFCPSAKGAPRWWDVITTPICNADGRPEQVLAVSRDITEHKRSEEALLERANEITQLNRALIERARELEISNRELESFAYSVSHDLRAPLRHVVGYAELLLKQASSVLDEKSHRYVQTILESSKRLGKLIDDLLAFSRIGRSESKMTLVSLDQLVAEAIAEIGLDTKGRDIVWKIDPLPCCYGDRAMLELVILNLLSNAVKFTSMRSRAEIQIGAVDREDEIELFVRDNGVGFEMKYVNKLFGVFQRLHLPEQFAGTGIGLATVRRIIEHHGGTVRAEGGVDQGATFYVSLPRQQETAERSAHGP